MFVDYSKIENQIHYRSFRKKHAPKERTGYINESQVTYASKQINKDLLSLNTLVKCPICNLYHLIPKFKFNKYKNY